MEKRNSQLEQGQSIKQTRGLFCTCDSMSITTTVSLLANEFDVRGMLHRQLSSVAVYQISVIHEAVNGCKNPKNH